MSVGTKIKQNDPVDPNWKGRWAFTPVTWVRFPSGSPL